jgi:secondary thiamine-phosphate synthase enzyme
VNHSDIKSFGKLEPHLTPDDWLLDHHGFPGFERFEEISHLGRGETCYHTEIIHLKLPKRYGIVHITSAVEEVLMRSGIIDGLVHLSTHHITTGFYINDAEPGLLRDMAEWLETLAPFGLNYRHHQTGEDNADAHLKSTLLNSFLTVPITDGRLDFGVWQKIFYADFDGMRPKKITVKVIGLKA